ncbi:MAG: hypothetical protein CMG66_04970 [Candidatus Marinimicrobia bacterium]|nr:hypothetical protein [Candidatus Neomarinimicrobiota bacterium]|tara:strand:- start:9495 stop:13886 length:4392 start_codon:yes stop_codon:yes gene_type:complete
MKLLINILLIFSSLISQEYNGPDDQAGDPSAIKEERMDGNRILLYFKNTTQLSNWEPPDGLYDVSIWPNDGTGYRMLDGVALLVGGKTYIYDDNNEKTLDTQILDDKNDIENNPHHEIYFLQTSYREEMDHDELDLVKWGFYPTFGYMNPYQDYPAMSDDSNTWPTAWPSSGSMTKWPGEWDGRFGRGVQYADLETYFVVNDAQDQEYLQNKWQCRAAEANNIRQLYETQSQCLEGCAYYNCLGSSFYGLNNCELYCDGECLINENSDECYPTENFEYYPIENKFIQDDASVQPGLPWGGLGLRVEARSFQWNNPLVRDALFWEYNITNISDYDINEMAFGYWVDNAIGGEGGSSGDDEVGYFDVQLDLAYSWDHNATGFGGGTPGIMGFAFLESPGISNDNIDNDNDGLIDESRDNDAGNYICATCGISNETLFLEAYDLKVEDLKEHYEGDEDQDWTPAKTSSGDDVLENNQICAIINDDVGLDGVGPNDINYTAPDEGECNGKPDCIEGVGCEPNFGETDISESDMLGLTAFKLFPVDGHQEDATTKWFKNDQIMWDSLMVINDINNAFDQFEGTPSNMIEVFSSSTFPLNKGRTERISMAEIHSMDNIQGSPGGTEPSVPALFALKQTVQLIYETDYRFAVPPNTPTLTAEAGDEKVILTWDNIAESSIDRFLPDSLQNDFEGYKIYKSTDKYFKDAQIITDGYGNPMFYEPIFQCDKIDSIQGFADYATVFGAAYYLGDDSGIEHKYIDTDVNNGRTYYYAVVAYDYGLEPNGQLENGIPPSENKALIQLDENEYVIGTGPNVAVVTPTAPSSGFIEPSLNFENNVSGTGIIDVEVYSQSLIENNQDYILTFENDTDEFNYLSTSGFSIFKKDEYCSGIDCEQINNQKDCFNQYGCDWINDTCITYPCFNSDNNEDCNLNNECYWNNGIFNGGWIKSAFSDSLLLTGDTYFTNSIAFKSQDNLNLEIFDNQIEQNDCYKFNFILESINDDTLKYDIDYISRFGNSNCLGNQILGYCESDNYGIFDEIECTDSGGNWISYTSEYPINTFDLWNQNANNGSFKVYINEFCEIDDFGDNYCEEFSEQDICDEQDGCEWNKLKLVYNETGEDSPTSFYQNHFILRENNNPEYQYWTLDPNKIITTDVIDGLLFSIQNIEIGSFKSKAWLPTNSYSGVSEPIISINNRMAKIKPWDCQIVFTNKNENIQTEEIFIYNAPPWNYYVLDEADQDISLNSNPNYLILNNGSVLSQQINIDFYIENTINNTLLDVLILDMNNTNAYEPLEDKILVGSTYLDNSTGLDYKFWSGTHFSISFNEYPEPGDIYGITYNSPFLSTDSLFINTQVPDSISITKHDIEINDIKVVPNPYVGTNLMEEAFSNPNQSQERKIMFTHLPHECTIKIFTTSGVLVDIIEVNNNFDNGMAYWDLLSNEGLEVAAGMYLYHVESKTNNKTKLGKFAILK